MFKIGARHRRVGGTSLSLSARERLHAVSQVSAGKSSQSSKSLDPPLAGCLQQSAIGPVLLLRF
jgi:hypothetical protein